MKNSSLVSLLCMMSGLALLFGTASVAVGSQHPVDELTPGHRTWLEEEVIYIITDKERDAFLSLQSVEERSRLIDSFWLRRDPDRNTPRNEFKEEHYRRFEYANENFVRQSSRPGWKTDQGRIYITLGEPREREKFEAHFNVAYALYSPVTDGPLRLVRGIDHFTLDPGVALKELLDISPNLARASLTFDMSENPDYTTGKGSISSEILVARIADAPKRNIRTDYVDAWLRYGNKVSSEYSFNFIPSRSVFSVLAGPQAVPFVHYRLEVDPQNFRLIGEEDKSKYYTMLDLSLEVTDSNGRSVIARDKEVYIELSPSEIERFDASPFAYQDDFPLVPGDYLITVILRNRAASQYTVAERSVSITAISPNEPGLSDVVLGYDGSTVRDDAHEGELRTFQVGAERVQPSADGVFFIGETAHAFFQVFGTRPGYSLRFELSGDEGVLEERVVSVETPSSGVIRESFPLIEITGGTYQLRVELTSSDGDVVAERIGTLNVSARNPLPRAWVHNRSFDTRAPGALPLAIGAQFQALEKYELAARALSAAVLADPEKAEARWRLAGIHLGFREPDEALALLLPLEERNGEKYEVAAGLGFAFYMKGELASAAQYLEKAIAIRPPTPGILNALADCHEKLGNAGEAKRLLERSLELDPDQTAIREKLAPAGDG